VRLVPVLILVIYLAGCATVPVGAGKGAFPPGPGIDNYPVWQFRGRVSLMQGEQGWHASLNWSEASGHYRLNLAGPMGQAALQLDGDGDGVRLRTASGEELVAGDADALVESATGWQLPVAGIRYWVRGVPAPAAEAQVFTDANGRPARLLQSGWDIRYSRFQNLEGRDWPTRMQLAAGDISVRLVIDEWRLTAGTGAAAGTPGAAAASPAP
jgi:outer membrane lipoprotein LolB